MSSGARRIIQVQRPGHLPSEVLAHLSMRRDACHVDNGRLRYAHGRRKGIQEPALLQQSGPCVVPVVRFELSSYRVGPVLPGLLTRAPDRGTAPVPISLCLRDLERKAFGQGCLVGRGVGRGVGRVGMRGGLRCVGYGGRRSCFRVGGKLRSRWVWCLSISVSVFGISDWRCGASARRRLFKPVWMGDVWIRSRGSALDLRLRLGCRGRVMMSMSAVRLSPQHPDGAVDHG